MASSINLKNSGGSTLAITHSDSKGGKTIIGTDIVTSVATINDFPSVGIQDGDTVIVKDANQGGTFIYRSADIATNNGGTIFNGWCREYSGAVNVKWFGSTTDYMIIQKAIEVAYNNKLIFNNNTYNLTSGFTINSPIEIDMQGSVINFNTTTYSNGFTVLSDNVIIKKGEINIADADPTYPGQGGNSGTCIGAGNQGTGVGYKGMILEDLTLSWNRADGNGGALVLVGSTNNAVLRNINVKSNTGAVGNVIACEWGGLAVAEGTGHPHNILIENIIVGDLPNQIDERYLVWLSATFNIQVNNVNCNQCAGGVMVISGDNGNQYAPESYRRSVGSNIKVDTLSVNKVRANGIRIVGDATPTAIPYLNSPTISNCVITCDPLATVPIGILVEYSTDAVIQNCKIKDGYYGINLNVQAKRIKVRDCIVEGSRYSGIVIGSASGGNEDCIVDSCKLNMNANLSSADSHGGVSIANAKNTTVTNCSFGEIGTTETTNYQIAVGANVKKLNLNNNYVNNVASGGIGIYTGLSTDTDILPNGNGNGGEAGFTLFGGLPIREIDGAGNITFRSTIAPVGGTYKQGDRVILSNPSVGGVKGWYCTVSGTPGTWVADAIL